MPSAPLIIFSWSINHFYSVNDLATEQQICRAIKLMDDKIVYATSQINHLNPVNGSYFDVWSIDTRLIHSINKLDEALRHTIDRRTWPSWINSHQRAFRERKARRINSTWTLQIFVDTEFIMQIKWNNLISALTSIIDRNYYAKN